MELIDIAKEKVKLIDYVQGNKKIVGNRANINPCPKCGHKDHFTIYLETNTYYSQSGCCGGGSIVDYLIKIENFEISKALSYVLELAGLKEENKKTVSEINKLKEERLKQQKRNHIKVRRWNLLYHKLTNFYKLVSKISLDNRTALITWIYDFVDRYTQMMIENPNNYGLVENFKESFDYEFRNFLTWEKKFDKQYGGEAYE